MSNTNGKSANGTSEKPKEYGPATKLLHSKTKPSHWTHSPIVAPIYTTTTFEVLEPGNVTYDYSRSDNPTRTELQSLFASAEGCKYGLAFSSGLGATATLSYLLRSGQNIICCDDVYGGTNRFFSKCLNRMGVTTTYVDGTVLKNWTNNFQVGKTRMVWIETPTNPTLKVIDIDAVVKAIKGLDEDCIVVVDNTFMTPILQKPINMGADVIVHSCSKYMGGHSDIIMGALMTNNEQLYKELKFLQNAVGITPSAYDCALMVRSLKTLELRVRKQSENAMIIADFLNNHKHVEQVLFPGLKDHPQHEIVTKQCSGFGAMLSFYIASKNGDEAIKFMNAVKIFHPAESLGCVCSLIEVPSLMTHASVPETARVKLGITDSLLRMSVGLENHEDLIDDLKQAFVAVFGNEK